MRACFTMSLASMPTNAAERRGPRVQPGKPGLTNTYTCQLLLGQAQLKEATAERLKAALPTLTPEDIVAMQRAPLLLL